MTPYFPSLPSNQLAISILTGLAGGRKTPPTGHGGSPGSAGHPLHPLNAGLVARNPAPGRLDHHEPTKPGKGLMPMFNRLLTWGKG